MIFIDFPFSCSRSIHCTCHWNKHGAESVAKRKGDFVFKIVILCCPKAYHSSQEEGKKGGRNKCKYHPIVMALIFKDLISTSHAVHDCFSSWADSFLEASYVNVFFTYKVEILWPAKVCQDLLSVASSKKCRKKPTNCDSNSLRFKPCNNLHFLLCHRKTLKLRCSAKDCKVFKFKSMNFNYDFFAVEDRNFKMLWNFSLEQQFRQNYANLT